MNTIVSVYKRNPKEVPEGRLVSFLLSNEAIAADGGKKRHTYYVREFNFDGCVFQSGFNFVNLK